MAGQSKGTAKEVAKGVTVRLSAEEGSPDSSRETKADSEEEAADSTNSAIRKGARTQPVQAADVRRQEAEQPEEAAKFPTSPAGSRPAAAEEDDLQGQGLQQGRHSDRQKDVGCDDQERAAKACDIRQACINGDLPRLRSLAVSAGGFLTDDLRQMAWSVLLGIPVDAAGHVDAEVAAAKADIRVVDAATDWLSLPVHRDEEQVRLDVNRAFVYYPTHSSSSEEDRQRRGLSDLIVQVLRRHPYLRYFQGLHDIFQVFFLVMPPSSASASSSVSLPSSSRVPPCRPSLPPPPSFDLLRAAAVLRLSLLRIRDFMLPSIDAAVDQLQLLPDILRVADPPLWEHLRLAQHPQPFFALSGTLTMYAHDMRSLGAIARVFDVLLAEPPAFSLYFFAAIVCAHRKALFATPADEPEMLHHILSKLPGKADGEDSGDDLDDFYDYKDQNGDDIDGSPPPPPPLDDLITFAARLADRFPPSSLPSWRAISSGSVLKTAHDPPSSPTASLTSQTLGDGHRFFDQHVAALDRAKLRRRQRERLRLVVRQYRGPLRAAGLAVMVGLLAMWLRRTGSLNVGHELLSSAIAKPLAVVVTVLSRFGLRLF